jgi:hypothetical protein
MLLFLPIFDYLKTRRNLAKKILISLIPALIVIIYALFFNVRNGINISEVFMNFVSVQINAVAILISFSLAIITILVSADNNNVRRLKEQEVTEGEYKPLDGKPLTLFQVLLSNITYNVFIEIVYLAILIGFIFLQTVLPIEAIKYLTGMSIFFIIHILHVLLESVVQMYLTFWEDKSKA